MHVVLLATAQEGRVCPGLLISKVKNKQHQLVTIPGPIQKDFRNAIYTVPIN